MNIKIITYGCTANQLHSEVMAGLLEKAGHNLVEDIKEADVVIINTCIVKEPTELKILHKIKKVRKSYPEKKLIIAGCMPSGEKEKLSQFSGLVLVGTQNINDIAEAVKSLKSFVEKKPEPKLCGPKIRKNTIVNITEISQGCDNACAFCITRIAKGRLYCYPPELVLEDIKSAITDGCREIWITSQDNSSYNVAFSRQSFHRASGVSSFTRGRYPPSSKGYSTQNLMKKTEIINLPKLLEEICKLSGDFFVRVGMMNPSGIGLILNQLIEAYKNPKVFKFLHIPVQSGSDTVLKKMNRKYKAADFEKIVLRFRKEISEITISTDVIAGFPGETEKGFEQTLQLLKKIKPDIVNLSKFGKRPGTPAEKMEQVDSRTIKERSVAASKLVKEILSEKNKKWLGWRGWILIDEEVSGGFIGRNFAYKPVFVKGKGLFGKKIEVEIVDARPTYLAGERI